MFIFTKKKNQKKSIATDNSDIITRLAQINFPEFSHKISHKLSEGNTLEISYILETEHLTSDLINNTSQCIQNFLELYVIPNFVLPYFASLRPDQTFTSEESIKQSIQYCKICINNDQHSSTIEPTKIFYKFQSKIALFVQVFNCTLLTIVKTLVEHLDKKLDSKLTISFDITINTTFSIERLNNTIENNIQLTKRIVKLYPIIKIYNSFPTINIFPEAHKPEFKITTAYNQNSCISICLTTNNSTDKFQISKQLIAILCKRVYLFYSFLINDLYNHKIDQLPNIQAQDLTHDSQHHRRVHVVIYHPDCSLPIKEIFYNVDGYIYLMSQLFGEKNLKVSIKLSLKEGKEWKEPIEGGDQFNEKCEDYDLTTKSSIKNALCKMYFKTDTNFFAQYIRHALIDNKILAILERYNLHINIEIPYNLATSITASTKENPTTAAPILTHNNQPSTSKQAYTLPPIPDSTDTKSTAENNQSSTSKQTYPLPPIPHSTETESTAGNNQPSTSKQTYPLPPIPHSTETESTAENNQSSTSKQTYPLPRIPDSTDTKSTVENKTTDITQESDITTSSNQSTTTTQTQPHVTPTKTTIQRINLPPIVKLRSLEQERITTPIIPLILEKKTESTNTTTTPKNNSYKKKTIFTTASIIMLTVIAIGLQYALTNKLLSNNPHLSKINIIITAGIIFCSAAILIGFILYYKTQASHTLINTIVAPSMQDNSQTINRS